MPIRRYNANMKANKSDSCNITEEIRGGRGEPPLSSSPFQAGKIRFLVDTGSPCPGEEIQGGSSPGTNDPAPAISGGNRGGFKLLQHAPHTSLGLHTFLA